MAQARDQLASRGSYGHCTMREWPRQSHSSHSVKLVFCAVSGGCDDGSIEEFFDGGGDNRLVSFV